MGIREPIKEDGQLICPHDHMSLIPVGGNGKPRSLECFCGYVWYLGAKIEISDRNTLVPGAQGKRYSPEKRERIKEMVKQGKGRMDIALALGVSEAAVDYYRQKASLTKPTPRISVEDKRIVVELAKKKYTNKIISQKTGLTASSVFYIRSCARATGEL